MAFFTWLQKRFAPRDPALPPPPDLRERVSCACDRNRRRDMTEACMLAYRVRDAGDSPDMPEACPAGIFQAGELSGPPDADLPDGISELGVLYRERGDFEQAVLLRETVLALPNTSPALRARTFFELGRDYRHAGLLDRALLAYKDARKAGCPESAVNEDLLQLYADSGDFPTAAAYAAKLGNIPAQAFFLVRAAEEEASGGRDGGAAQLLDKAVSLFPGSPEARLARASMFLLGGNGEKALAEVVAGLTGMGAGMRAGSGAGDAASGRLLLLEGLYTRVTGSSAPNITPAALRVLVAGLHAFIGAGKPDVTACYYCGLFLQTVREDAPAEQWFTKALVMDPDFWAARLALLVLAAAREDLPPLLAEQVAFFKEAGTRSKRFVCPPCGLRRDTIFSQCPRCRSWHSAAFRLRLT